MTYPSLFVVVLTTEDGTERAYAVVAMDDFEAEDQAKKELGLPGVTRSAVSDFGSIAEVPVAGFVGLLKGSP